MGKFSSICIVIVAAVSFFGGHLLTSRQGDREMFETVRMLKYDLITRQSEFAEDAYFSGSTVDGIRELNRYIDTLEPELVRGFVDVREARYELFKACSRIYFLKLNQGDDTSALEYRERAVQHVRLLDPANTNWGESITLLKAMDEKKALNSR